MAPVMAGDEQIEVFFSGNGRFTYRSTDPIERSLVLFEAKRLDRTHKLADDGTVTVQGTFERLYVRSFGVELAKPGVSAAESLQSVFKQHRDAFSNVRATPPSHLLIRQRLDDPSAAVAVVDMAGKDNHR